MKKFIGTLSLLILILGLTSCQTTSPAKSETVKDEQISLTTEFGSATAPAPFGETVVFSMEYSGGENKEAPEGFE